MIVDPERVSAAAATLRSRLPETSGSRVLKNELAATLTLRNPSTSRSRVLKNELATSFGLSTDWGPWVEPPLLVAVGGSIGRILEWVLARWIGPVARRRANVFDDALAAAFRRPLRWLGTASSKRAARGPFRCLLAPPRA